LLKLNAFSKWKKLAASLPERTIGTLLIVKSLNSMLEVCVWRIAPSGSHRYTLSTRMSCERHTWFGQNSTVLNTTYS
jgi:hypothetical protein